jgi:uncharacterized membrane protein (DUF373 family)
MLQISYISAATTPMSTKDLLALLQKSRENNANSSITGMLLYGNGAFLQVLEGEEQPIDRLIEKIKNDSRHTNIKMLYRKHISQRQYSDWSMGFNRISDKELRQVESLNDLSAAELTPDYFTNHISVVQSLMDHFRRERIKTAGQSELGIDEDDPMINILHRIIRMAVRILAILMVVTIIWGIVDVISALYFQVFQPSFEGHRAREIIVVFGSFLAVLIAIEIFLNITLYLRDDVVHVKLVIATALMAIARKVIIFDFEKTQPMYILATAAVVFSLGIVHWLMDYKPIMSIIGRSNRHNEDS